MREPIVILIKEDGDRAEREQHQLKAVKNDLMLKVDAKNTDEQRRDEHGDTSVGDILLPEKERADEPTDRVGKLDRRIAEGDMRFTASAFASEHEIGKHGDIIVPAKLIFTGGTVGRGLGKAHSVRQAVDHHVEKAADTQADDARKDVRTNQIEIIHTPPLESTVPADHLGEETAEHFKISVDLGLIVTTTQRNEAELIFSLFLIHFI